MGRKKRVELPLSDPTDYSGGLIFRGGFVIGAHFGEVGAD